MSTEIEQLLNEYRLTTAEILYHFPDYPSLLQTYVWQELDLTPDFPNLYKFLNFWESFLDGKLHSVSVSSCEVIKSSEIHLIDKDYIIH